MSHPREDSKHLVVDPLSHSLFLIPSLANPQNILSRFGFAGFIGFTGDFVALRRVEVARVASLAAGCKYFVIQSSYLARCNSIKFRNSDF